MKPLGHGTSLPFGRAVRGMGHHLRRGTPNDAVFGSVHRLPSGRYQVRYTDARMERHTAPLTFATRREAQDYLTLIR